jgi:hypothetical protein
LRTVLMESGLNDGICVPLLFAAVAIVDVETEISGSRSTRDSCAGLRLHPAQR